MIDRRQLLRGAGAGAALAVLAACRDDHPDPASPTTVEPPETGPEPGPENPPESGPETPSATGPEDPSATGPTPATWTGPRVDVQAIDNTFRPDLVEVAPGTMVVWTNRGRNDHDVLVVEGTWGVEKELFPPDAVFGHVFDEPGEYDYYCTIHGTAEIGMVGTVIVTG